MPRWNEADTECGPCTVERLSQTDYMRVFVVLVLLVAYFAYCALAFFVFVIPLRLAGTARHATQPDEYGWFLKANTSLFSPEAMAYVVDNASSPYDGLWVPPPEWEPHCTASYGVPMTACSYFLAEHYPTFTTVFYVLWFLLELVGVLIRLHIFYYAAHELYMWIKLNGPLAFHVSYLQCVTRDLGGGKAGVNKARGISMYRTLIVMVPAICFIGLHCIVLESVYTFAGAGLGLVHSFRSGRLYLGAGWGRAPLPTLDDLVPIMGLMRMVAWNMAPRLWAFLALPANLAFDQALHSPFGYLNFQHAFAIAYTHFFVRAFGNFNTHLRHTAQEMADQVATKSASAGVPASFEDELGYPKRFSCREYLRWFCCSRESFWHTVVYFLVVVIAVSSVVDFLENYKHWMPAVPAPRTDADAIEWFAGMHFFARTQLGVTAIVLFLICLMTRFQIKKVRADAELAGGANFSNRIRGALISLAKTIIPVVVNLFVATLIVPNGALRQTIGVEPHPAATDPGRWYGANAYETANLLSAPVCALVLQFCIVGFEAAFIAPWSPWTLTKRRDYSMYRRTKTHPAS